MACLTLDGKSKIFPVHRLVAGAFLGPCPDGMETCHNDGDNWNNVLSNLRYDTHKNNMADCVSHGTHSRGERCGKSKLTIEDIREIRRFLDDGWQNRFVAMLFRVSKTSISHIKSGRCWAHCS
jgi:HNH endonuclease